MRYRAFVPTGVTAPPGGGVTRQDIGSLAGCPARRAVRAALPKSQALILQRVVATVLRISQISGPGPLTGQKNTARVIDSENESQLVYEVCFLRSLILVIDQSIPLSSLHAGQSALISRIAGQPDHIHRLEEFGLRGGTRIQMFSPGNPCILRMAVGKVCFRTDDVLNVFVEPDTRPSK